MMDTSSIVFHEGEPCCQVGFVDSHLRPFFADGTIPPFPGADYYAVCYGELAAYSDSPSLDPRLAPLGHKRLLAIWSVTVPDCEADADPDPDYTGEWEPYSEV